MGIFVFISLLLGGLALDALGVFDGRASDEAEPEPELPEGDDAPVISGTFFSELLVGTEASQEIYGRNGADTIIGGGGEDTLLGGQSQDIVTGGPDNDILLGGDQQDTLDGGAGNDSLDGGAWADTVADSQGQDTLMGGLGDDWIDATNAQGDAADLVFGNEGNDTIRVDDGDTVVGGTGVDVIDIEVAEGNELVVVRNFFELDDQPIGVGGSQYDDQIFVFDENGQQIPRDDIFGPNGLRITDAQDGSGAILSIRGIEFAIVEGVSAATLQDDSGWFMDTR